MQRGSNRSPGRKQILDRAGDLYTTLFGRFSQDCFWFDVGMFDELCPELSLNSEVRSSKSLLNISLADFVVNEGILESVFRRVIMKPRRIRTHRLFGIRYNRQRLVLDFDERECLLGNFPRSSRDQCNAISQIADLVQSKYRLVLYNNAKRLAAGNILRCQHGFNAGELYRFR